MRRYQLSGLDHVHMMRRVPRSYDMTRTHILHRGVNKHVDVVLKCSPKNWKKKKVTVSVVKSDKKNEAARIRANAKKGYVAVRKRPVNEAFEADRRIVATACEKKYGGRTAGSDAIIHDMRSQLSAMAKKSADYMDRELAGKPTAIPTAIPTSMPKEPVISDNGQSVPPSGTPAEQTKPLISPETEEILRKGGYRVTKFSPTGNPYAADYSMHASNEEFHLLMDSLEKELDEACRKYAVQPVDVQPEAEREDSSAGSEAVPEAGNTGYADYSGSYKLPSDVSLSVTHKQEITAVPKKETETLPEDDDSFKPALTFANGGEHYTPEDDLFERKLGRPEGGYVPPAYFFDDEEDAPAADAGSDTVPMPEPEPVPIRPETQPRDIFNIVPEETSGQTGRSLFDLLREEDSAPVSASQPEPAEREPEQEEIDIFHMTPEEKPERRDDDVPSADYPQEDYVQQQVMFPSGQEDGTSDSLYNPPAEEADFAEPTMYADSHDPQEEGGYEPPMVGADRDEDQPAAFPDDEDDLPPPMIFPDDDEDAPPPMIFPDDGEDEGYSPAPVSRDRNEYFTEGRGGVVNRSGETMFSRTGDRVKKVIGVIRGAAPVNVTSKRRGVLNRNSKVDITYSDTDE